MALRVGQKVMCINVDRIHKNNNKGPVTDYLSLGGVYTIRWVGESPYKPWRHLGPHVRLLEVRRPEDNPPEWSDFPFCAFRFRPIVERKTDISVFTAMLNPSLEDVANLILQEVTL